MTPQGPLLPLAILLCVHAALAGLSWLRLLMAERAARRRGMALNLARRAGPPVGAGIAVLVFASAAGMSGAALPAGLLIGGGASYGLLKGLAEARQGNWRSLGFRLLVSLGLTLGALWLMGLAQPAALG